MPSDAEFVPQLVCQVKEFLRTLDDWEREYARYYRLVAPASVSPDLLKLHEDFKRAQRALQASVPRARRLCLKYGLRDPFPGLRHLQLGVRAPQSSRYTPALGRSERSALLDCVHAMEHAVLDERLPPLDSRGSSGRPDTWWRRLWGYFD